MNRRLIIIFGVILFLVIITVAALWALNSNKQVDIIKTLPDVIEPTSYNPAITRIVIKPSPVLNPTFILEPTTVLEEIDEEGVKSTTFVVSDQQNINWQRQKPKVIAVQFDPGQRLINVALTDRVEEDQAYMWLVGYSETPFNPVEKFRLPNISTIKWNGTFLPDDTTGNVNSYTISLFEFSPDAQYIYFYIYKRTKTVEGRYIDYIYGNNDSVNTPFIQKVYQS